GALDYKWEFGDQTSSILESPNHTYLNESNVDSVYPVRLTVISENFCTDSAFATITVFPEPKAKFDVDQTVGCSPLNVNVENLTEAGNTYTWTFGDGSAPLVLTDTSPVSHSYINDQLDAIYLELRLEVTNTRGCSDFITQTITVYPSVDVDFERDSAGCSPYFSQFTNTSIRASTLSGISEMVVFLTLANPAIPLLIQERIIWWRMWNLQDIPSTDAWTP
ncbi:MAG: PKD domain-containing protein, partial [Bacteroidales bacterium]|nr:PKD domain-containing protein [Bacteroidales bacterium]